MVDNDNVRTLALDLPEAVEADHMGRPSIQVRRRIFAVLRPSERAAVLKLPLDEQEVLVTLQPDTFSLGGWSHQGWTFVNLEIASPGEFAALLELAWHQLVPQRPLRALEEKRRDT